MLFNIEHDRGDEIKGYLVPDNFSSLCRVRLVHNGAVAAIFETREERPALVAGARHENGRCGFTIDDRDIPNLASQADLEIYDDETGCLVYRRLKPSMIARKIIRFETQLMPLWRLDERLFPYFQYVGKAVDQFGRESVTQMLLLNDVHSFYVSGRLNYRNYAFYIDNGFECFAMVQPPHDECAERLLVLRNAAKVGLSFLGERDAKRYEPAIRFAEAMPLDDLKALRRMLQDMPDEVAALLANPLVRLLSTANPDDMPGPSAVAGALDVLSSFSVLGFRERGAEFNAALGEWLEIDAEPLPVMPPLAAVAALSDVLTETKVLDAILEKDIELFYHVREAIKPIECMTSINPTIIDGSVAPKSA